MNIMNDTLDKTSICSVVALDIIDFSKKSVDEQVEIKNQLNSLINQAVIDIPQSDRVIVDKPNGAAIACNGALEDALEDVLFISLTIRDEILKNNANSLKPWYVQVGINLGTIRVVDKKGKQDIVGDGVAEAQRIMSFANPNQILVSRVYYDMASKLTQEISTMFEQYDMHAHEQEIYAVQHKQSAKSEAAASLADEVAAAKSQLGVSNINWMYAALGLFAAVVVFAMGKQMLTPTSPTITMEQPVDAPSVGVQPGVNELKPSIEPLPKVESAQTSESTEVVESRQSASTKREAPNNTKAVQKKSTQKNVAEAKPSSSSTEKPATKTSENQTTVTAPAKSPESKKEAKANHEKSGWDSFRDSVKQGSESKCTQAEIAMNQCIK